MKASDADCDITVDVGDVVVFIIFNRKTIGRVTGFITDEIVLIDAGAGEMEIQRSKIIRNVYDDSVATII